ncbi:MAG: hypothetical protein GSR85_05035 [Desulfurococcales archaeon]|nr:hypothetical protein [Desulfurococcales archaeon]
MSRSTVVDQLLEEMRVEKARLNREEAVKEVKRLADALKGFDFNVIEDPPGIVVRLPGFVVYIIVYQPGVKLVAAEARRVLEGFRRQFDSLRKARIKPVAIFYSRRGVLGPLAYLYLGQAMEDMGIGVLFINGGLDEVLEVLWSLENKGEYRAEEEDYVSINF